jgi:DNA-binding response OmpR family regulator
LILDNDPAAASVTTHGLSRALGDTAEILAVNSADEAWAECQERPVSLLIVDPILAHQQISNIVGLVRNKFPRTEVLVLASHDTPRVRRAMRALGVNHYLAKPIDLPSITAEVRALLARHNEVH